MISSIGEAFSLTAKLYADKPAIVCGTDKVSYQTLQKKNNQVYSKLTTLGIQSGDCVAILLPNSIEFVTCFYGITELGAVALPINHLYQEKEIQYYLVDSNVKAIITDAQRLPLCEQSISPLEQSIHLILIDQDMPEDSSSGTASASDPSGVVKSSVSSHQEALYLYSSGSTGRPKRVPKTHENLLQEVQSLRDTIQISPDDSILCLVPLYHAHGLGNCLLAATCNGATLVLIEPVLNDGLQVEVPFMFRCPRVFEILEHENITIFPAVPYIFKALAETPLNVEPNVSTLRLSFSAGNFLNKDIFDKFKERFAIPIRQLYGCTEAGAVSINHNDPIEETWNSVGRPLRGVDIMIVNDQGVSLPQGEVGEVVICTKALTHGYANLEDLNQQAFKNGMYFTGDLGKLDAQGNLYISGRKKILIDTGGRKVDPIEIEDILLSHPLVQEAVVVGVKDTHAGEIIKAVLVINTSASITEQDIFSYCKENLADFKIPKIVEFIDEIPKSPLGKILRKALV